MKKNKSSSYLRLVPLLLLAPLIYWIWENEGSEELTQKLRGAQQVEAIHVGNPAPSLVIESAYVWDRKALSLATWKGKPIVLHFWATWCGPCLKELPELIELSEQLTPKGFTFITVAVDENWQVIEKFFKTYPTLAKLPETTHLILDPESKVAQLYGSQRFPETFLINTDQIMDNKFIGPQPWTKPEMAPFLNKLLLSGERHE